MQERERSPLWFIRLRWLAFLGLMLVLAAAILVFRFEFPGAAVTAVLLLIPISNLAAQSQAARVLPETALVGTLLAIDTVVLTVILHHAGGPTNPFTNIYLLYVVLAAVMLSPAWAWSITAITSLCFALLFVAAPPAVGMHDHGSHHGFSLHLHGMFFAYVIVATLVSYFLNKIVGELRKKERKLERLENVTSNQQRLASLATITASAAHEFGTPLATIAVVTRELERNITKKCPDPGLLEDLALLKTETMRCKQILADLSEKTGDLMGEAPQSVSVGELITDAVEALRVGERIQPIGALDIVLPSVPRKAIAIALKALLKNAVEASASPVEVEVAQSNQDIQILVRDRGPGIDADTLERVGEPFFSTKTNEHGTGLGVYLSRLTVEQLGGNLDITSELGKGTCATLTLPTNSSTLEQAA